MDFFDAAKLTARTITPEGYLIAPARVGRPGVQAYKKGIDFVDSDLPERLRGRPEGSDLRLMRPVEEVFDSASVASFKFKPVVLGHPLGAMVDAGNVRQFQVGFASDVRPVDGKHIEADLVIQDRAAIDAINNGTEEVSLGYSCAVDWTPGIDPTWGAYDGAMRGIIGNHIAIVDRARAGSDFRLADGQIEKEQKMNKRVVDGITVELTDQAVEVVDKMKATIDAQAGEIEAQKKIADGLRGELEASKAAAAKPEDTEAEIQRRVVDHLKVVDAVRPHCPDLDTAGKSAGEIKAAAVVKLSDGAIDVAGKSAEFIDAAFLTLTTVVKSKNQQIGDAIAKPAPVTEDPRAKMIAARGRR